MWGHSLGSGPAVKLAYELQTRSPPSPLRALVLEAPYTSLLDACRTFPSGHVIRALPYGDLLMLRYFYFHFPILRMLPSVKSPTLVLHGTSDVLVPFQHTVELAKACAAEGRAGSSFTFVPLRGCSHLHAIFQPQTLGALAKFFAAIAKVRAQAAGGSEWYHAPRRSSSSGTLASADRRRE